jgi:hypothetical protein
VIDPIGALRRMPREHAADLVTAAAYGSVLLLGALAFVEPADVADGHGLELIAGVGVATWVAHVFADLVGEHVRHPGHLESGEVRWSFVSGVPILVATVLPGIALGLGRLQVISDKGAIWAAVMIGAAQMVMVGAIVGSLRGTGRRTFWWFVLATGVFGIAVTAVKINLGH